MSEVYIIAKKEFKDHISDTSFLLCFAALFIAMVGGAFYQVQVTQDLTLRWINAGILPMNSEGWRFLYYYFTEYVTSQLSSLGVLTAIALSFNSINKERTEGSLKVLLSYPVFRDKIILGKILAGLMVISLVTISVMIISFSILMFYLSIPLTIDFFLRVVTVTVTGIVLLAFFFCIGMAISTIVSDTSTILLSLLLVVTILQYNFIEVVVTIIINYLSILGLNLLRPTTFSRQSIFRPWYDPFYRTYSHLSPIESYLKYSERIFSFGEAYDNAWFVERGYPITQFQYQFVNNLDLALVPLIFTIAAFVACYILFTRREIA